MEAEGAITHQRLCDLLLPVRTCARFASFFGIISDSKDDRLCSLACHCPRKVIRLARPPIVRSAAEMLEPKSTAQTYNQDKRDESENAGSPPASLTIGEARERALARQVCSIGPLAPASLASRRSFSFPQWAGLKPEHASSH
jgi:hypothetical protein